MSKIFIKIGKYFFKKRYAFPIFFLNSFIFLKRNLYYFFKILFLFSKSYFFSILVKNTIFIRMQYVIRFSGNKFIVIPWFRLCVQLYQTRAFYTKLRYICICNSYYCSGPSLWLALITSYICISITWPS